MTANYATFFEIEVPARLQQLRCIGASFRARCLFELEGAGGGLWLVDATGARRLEAGAAIGCADADCRLRLPANEFSALLRQPEYAHILAWQGRLEFAGEEHL